MKFDVVIMNPPWGQIGWKIINEVYKHCTNIVAVNTSNILHSLSRFEAKSYFQTYKDMFDGIEEEILINNGDGQCFVDTVTGTSQWKVFKIGDKRSCKYSYYDWIEEKLIDHIEKYPVLLEDNVLSKYAIYLPRILSKTYDRFHVLRPYLLACENRNGVMTCIGEYVLHALSRTVKNKIGRPWYDCILNCKDKKTTPYLTAGIAFNTEAEMRHFCESQLTKFMRFANSRLISDVNISSKNILWMNDYKEPWTDERFYKYFNLTPEEIEEVESYAL